MKNCIDCGKTKSNRGSYCKPCGYKHRKRPSGLKYDLRVENKTWFPKGNKPWNTGTIGKIIAWNKGIEGSIKPNNTSFTSFNTSKEKNVNWKGGITPLTQVIRHCFKYRQWISDVFQRDEYICQECGKVGGILNAHHIKSFSLIFEENKISSLEEALNCEEFWNINNGQTLCKECHMKTKNYGNKKK